MLANVCLFQEIANRVELAAAGSGQVPADNVFAKVGAKRLMHQNSSDILQARFVPWAAREDKTR